VVNEEKIGIITEIKTKRQKQLMAAQAKGHKTIKLAWEADKDGTADADQKELVTRARSALAQGVINFTAARKAVKNGTADDKQIDSVARHHQGAVNGLLTVSAAISAVKNDTATEQQVKIVNAQKQGSNVTKMAWKAVKEGVADEKQTQMVEKSQESFLNYAQLTSDAAKAIKQNTATDEQMEIIATKQEAGRSGGITHRSEESVDKKSNHSAEAISGWKRGAAKRAAKRKADGAEGDGWFTPEARAKAVEAIRSKRDPSLRTFVFCKHCGKESAKKGDSGSFQHTCSTQHDEKGNGIKVSGSLNTKSRNCILSHNGSCFVKKPDSTSSSSADEDSSSSEEEEVKASSIKSAKTRSKTTKTPRKASRRK